MKILVTGANGFIGQTLVRYLDGKCEYICPVRCVDGTLGNPEYCYISGIDSTTEWSEFLKGIDAVIHLAGLAHISGSIDPNIEQQFFEVNTFGTINLARQAVKAGVKRFVFVSTIGVLGSETTGAAFDESTVAKPVGPYAESKYKAENALLDLCENNSMELVIIRPPLIYGKNAPGNFGLLEKIVSKLPVLPFGMIQNTRSLVSVYNLAEILYLCAIKPGLKQETFVVADIDISTRRLCDQIAESKNLRRIQLPIPAVVFKVFGKLFGLQRKVRQLVGDLQIDSSRARRVLGWSPSLSIQDSLQQQSNYLRDVKRNPVC